jgi:tetratricopeptide (TPR) repeat protein
VTRDPAELHRLGVAATARGDPAAGSKLLRTGLRAIGWPTGTTDPHLAARLLISLAHAQALQGLLTTGLGHLDAAATIVATADRGVLAQQRGLLLFRAGRIDEALEWLNAAIPLLANDAHRDVEARAFLNRGTLHLTAGRVSAARADLRRCAELARAAGMTQLAAKAEHNVGYCDYLTGDIPAALHAYGKAERALAGEPGLVGVVLMDRARALLQAGLVRDAGIDLDLAIELFAQQRLRQDQAEAELARAYTALAAGDNAAAIRWARQARSRFNRCGNTTGAALADVTLLRSRLHTAKGLANVAAQAVVTAAVLDTTGLTDDGALAMLVGIRALIAHGNPEAARAMLGHGLRRRATSLESRSMYALALAELAVADGNVASAGSHLRAGLAAMQRHRSRFGSLELQAGVQGSAMALASLGTQIAWVTGSPPQIYRWSERSRTHTERLPYVHTDRNPELVGALAALRHARQTLRQTALSGHRAEPHLRAQVARLERTVRHLDWEVPGSARVPPQSKRSHVINELAATESTMICLIGRDRYLGALILAPRQRRPSTIADLGPAAPLVETATRLRSDLDVLASRRLPTTLKTTIHRALTEHMAAIESDLLRRLSPMIESTGPLVIVPMGAFSILPWGCLPRLRGRPVCVTPSATAWLRAKQRANRNVQPRDDPVVLVGGPGLHHAKAEIASIAAMHRTPVVLDGDTATVEAALHAIDGAATVHVAAHGEHDPDNGLFSRIDLVDGPLMGYDLQRLRVPPRDVVLAACDIGRAATQASDGFLGFTTALLHVGASSVVAGVARIHDESTARVMTEHHRSLVRGCTPAEALGIALQHEPLTPLVCFGSS